MSATLPTPTKPQAPAPPPESVAAAAPPPSDATGHALAAEIQALLDAEKSESSAAHATAAAPASTAAPKSADAQTAEPVNPGDPAAKETVHHIDEMLAKGADNAISGDFETVEEVMHGKPAPRVSTAAPAVAPASPAVAAAATPTPAPAVATTQSAAAPVPDFQPERKISAPPPTAADAAPPPKTRKGLSLRLPVSIDIPLRRALAVINRPLAGLKPVTQNLVGYVGLISLFNAIVCLVYVKFLR